ncbi:hypothetical protein V6N13_065681 [Hibiscus sabdariffa]
MCIDLVILLPYRWWKLLEHLGVGQVGTQGAGPKGNRWRHGLPIGAGGVLGLRPMGPDGGLDLLTDGGGG